MRSLLFALFFLLACGDGGSGPDASPPDASAPDACLPGMPSGARPDAAPFDCLSVPPGPFSPVLLPGFVPIEDLAFDDAGHVIENDAANIYKTRKDGTRTTFVSDLPFRAGMRLTPAGDLIVNDDSSGSLVRIDTCGVRHTLLMGLQFPHGMEIDLDGWVYITEMNADRVLRVHPFTGDHTVLVDGLISAPAALSFNVDYTVLYVAGFSGVGTIYSLAINPDGTPGGVPTPFVTGVGTGLLHGMDVDFCGNIYVSDYGASQVLRISPDGATRTVIISGNSYLPNMEWGRGLGGWREDHLYFAAVGEGLLEVDVGVPSKPRW